MLIPCYRCDEMIDKPGLKGRRLKVFDEHGQPKTVVITKYNADYIIGKDTGGKTAIIHPQCFDKTDYVIWGIHKGLGTLSLPLEDK